MIWFYSAARFNESVNGSGRLESAEPVGLALPVSGALMFNYHKLVILIHLLVSLGSLFALGGRSVCTRSCAREGADGICASVKESAEINPR